MFTFLAEVLGNCRRCQRRFDTQLRRLIGRRDYRYSFSTSPVANPLQEAAYFFKLANQRQDDHVGRSGPRQHTDEGSLAYTALPENAHALAETARQKSINGTNPRADRLANGLPFLNMMFRPFDQQLILDISFPDPSSGRPLASITRPRSE